ncbi:polysaccharide biosynthesis protein [Bacillus sp. FJAT-28004]|uniref:polysaccharide biosynthesis protein n=1 Tax=Bacillus sp. FJAT-28004 TaxID=1679165 RepID=UPI000A9725F8|nr:polysaccharide biosynthesis protein [Bacillus sp. FJAT-28004]
MSISSQQISSFFRNKKILVTGGTGSIGEQIVSTLLTYEPEQIVVFNRDDTKQYLMKLKYANEKRLQFILGDIRDYDSVNFAVRGMDYVFHAAALKQVPICEENPFEAVKTNNYGSDNVIRASILNKVKKVINISTDKAINPSNTMGATKLITEKLFKQANYMLNNKDTKFCSVRFGNVIGSRGSVFPVLMNQALTGKPMTITDPNMTRFFMSIQEAANLTIKAACYCEGGETFILKMESLKLEDLSLAVQQYCLNKGLPLPVVRIVGIRPGEKLHEELLTEDELTTLVEDNELYVVLPVSRGKLKFRHFQPSVVTLYRSDKATKASIEQLVSILSVYGEV